MRTAQTFRTHRCVPTRALILALACVLSLTAGAQQFVQAGAGAIHPLPLPGDRVALLRADGDRVVVADLAAPPGATGPGPVDVRAADVISSFQGIVMPSLPMIREAMQALRSGDTVRLQVLRAGTVVPFEFAFEGPAMIVPGSASGSAGEPGEERTMAVPGGGGWNAAPGEEPTFVTDPGTGLLGEVGADEPGVSLAIADSAGTFTEVRGLASLELGVPMTAETLLPAASVTKVFTAFAIVTLAERGALSLDDDIQRHLPELQPRATPITVRHLLNHTSGFKDYTGLLSLTGWEFGDVVTREALMTLLARQSDLHFEPGTQHRYSNTNYFLLAEIVARASGDPFGDVVAQMALRPVGLERARVPGPGEVVAGRADGYRAGDDGFTRAATAEAAAGAGGLLATPSDLVAWGRALLAGRVGSDGVLAGMQEPGRLTDGSTIPYGAGLSESEFHGHRRLGHSGSMPGSASVLHLYPDDGLVVAVMANRDDVNVYEIAERVATQRLGVDTAMPSGGGGLPAGAMMITDEDFAGTDDAVTDDPDVARFAGRYRMEERGDDWVIEVEGGRVLLRLRDDLTGVPLVPQADGRYLFRPGRWLISFQEEGGEVTGLTLHLTEESVRRGDPRDVPGTRIVVRALTAAERAALTGEYFSEELGTVYRVLEAERQLWLEHPRLGRLALQHQVGDVFSLPGRSVARVEFRRDADGAVTGLNAEAYAWGANAAFERLR